MIGAAPSWKLICCTKCGRKRYYSQIQIDGMNAPYLCKSCFFYEMKNGRANSAKQIP